MSETGHGNHPSADTKEIVPTKISHWRVFGVYERGVLSSPDGALKSVVSLLGFPLQRLVREGTLGKDKEWYRNVLEENAVGGRLQIL